MSNLTHLVLKLSKNDVKIVTNFALNALSGLPKLKYLTLIKHYFNNLEIETLFDMIKPIPLKLLRLFFDFKTNQLIQKLQERDIPLHIQSNKLINKERLIEIWKQTP